MGYVAVKGGTAAIEESIKRLKYERVKSLNTIDIDHIQGSMRGLIDQIMSEASLYSKDLSAIAIKQSQGNIEECVFLLRAYRSTLPRKHYTNIVEPRDMTVQRRISASFKDIVGGQILGSSYDYTHRLMDFSLIDETESEIKDWLEEYKKSSHKKEGKLKGIPKVVDYLRNDNLIKNYNKCNEEPKDITKTNMEFPTTRAERLQALTRGQSGAVISLAYSALRSCGINHPTVGELRVGSVPITVANPLKINSADGLDKNMNKNLSNNMNKDLSNSIDDYLSDNLYINDDYYIGDIKITEVETLVPVTTKDEDNKSKIEFEVGYGICYGQNETKAISMSILDFCLEEKNKNFPTGDEEFVLMSIDSVESTGFISHLKLPHYVTFQSELNSVRKTHKEEVEYANQI